MLAEMLLLAATDAYSTTLAFDGCDDVQVDEGVPLLQRDVCTKSRFPPSYQQDAMAEALDSHSTLRSPLPANVSQMPLCAASILSQWRVTIDLIGNNVQVGLALSYYRMVSHKFWSS
ncbi:hypothetical protein MRX96_009470 [Rhipicephalus microplus]